jgi:hypothetical protein
MWTAVCLLLGVMFRTGQDQERIRLMERKVHEETVQLLGRSLVFVFFRRAS